MRSAFGYSEEKRLGKPYDIKLLKRLYPFTKPYRSFLFWSIVLVIFIAILDIALPILTKTAIDRYIVPQIESAANDSSNKKFGQKRFIEADLTDPDIRTVVLKYPGLFTIKNDQAFIPYEQITHIQKNDLMVLRKHDVTGLGVITILFIGIILAGFFLNFIQKIIMEYTGHMVMHDLRMKLFSHIQELSIHFFTRNPVARLVTRNTNDIQNMHELFTSVIAFVFKDLFLLIGITIVILWLNLKLALITFALLPFVLLASILFSFRAREIFRDLRIKIAEINTRFSETIQGIKVIQMFLHEKKSYGNFKKLNHDNYIAGMRQIKVLAVFLPVIEILGVFTIALIIYYGGGKVISNSLSLGDLVAFLALMKMYFRPIRDLAEKYNILQNAMASAERIFMIIDSEDSLPKPPELALKQDKEKPVLEKISQISVKNVFFSYTPDVSVLNGINFDINTGETIAVVGPTGSGKTTLISLITRFYDPVEGEICINGRDLREYETRSFRSKTALVMQDPFLFSETIHDNIFRGTNTFSESDKENILELSNCKSVIDRLPNGLYTVLGEGGTLISSGERQLVSIARAFAINPQLILFDEATSYIDTQTEQKIQQALGKLMKNRTALIVAHRLSTVRNADRIIVLNRGRMIETGTHSNLMKKRGFYYKLNQLQN